LPTDTSRELGLLQLRDSHIPAIFRYVYHHYESSIFNMLVS
jgi:hypothetical protein